VQTLMLRDPSDDDGHVALKRAADRQGMSTQGNNLISTAKTNDS